VNQDTLKIISTWAGALPVLAGLIVFKKAGLTYRLFTFFLIYGFLSDIAVWRFRAMGLSFEAYSVFNIYGLVEPLFFFWFIYRVSENVPVSDTAFILMLIVPVAWIFAYIDFNVIEWKRVLSSALFTTVYEMTVTVLTSWSILQLTQKTEPLRSIPAFWFLFGIFTFCICTFIVSSFFEKKDVRNQLWFVVDLTNIIAYFFYTTGFLKIETKKEMKIEN
jgi:hypothetical protein